MPLQRSKTSMPRWLYEPKLVVWATYLFLTPFYVFKSGLPQPGDLFVIVLVPVALYGWNGRLPGPARKAVRPLIWFTLWVAVVDYAWALALGKLEPFGYDSFVLYPVYYVYNTLVFLIVLILYRRYGDQLLKITLQSVFYTVVVLVASSLVVRSGDFRGSLFFNNPNQLGYFALLAGCMISLLHRRLSSSVTFTSIGMTCCAYLALLSASRAALGGLLLVAALLTFSNPRVLLLGALAAGGITMLGGPVVQAFESTQQRIERAQNRDVTFWEERGYDRIVKHPELTILGAGEGGLSRFAADSKIISRKGERKAIEIHSSVGMILFSYGIPGVVLFLLFLGNVIRGARLRETLMLSAPLLYTVAHQGLRFTLLWVLFAIFLTIKPDTPRIPRPI